MLTSYRIGKGNLGSLAWGEPKFSLESTVRSLTAFEIQAPFVAVSADESRCLLLSSSIDKETLKTTESPKAGFGERGKSLFFISISLRGEESAAPCDWPSIVMQAAGEAFCKGASWDRPSPPCPAPHTAHITVVQRTSRKGLVSLSLSSLPPSR